MSPRDIIDVLAQHESINVSVGRAVDVTVKT